MTTRPHPLEGRVPGAHGRRALAHGARSLLLLPFLAACADVSAPQEFEPHKGREPRPPEGELADDVTRIPADAPVPAWARAKIREYLEAMVRPPLDETSDVHDAWLHHTRRLTKALEQGGEHVGNAALHAFVGDAAEAYHTRRALLGIGARAAPESAVNLLHELTWNYGYRIEDRTEACLLLPEVDPEGYLEKAEEYLTRRGRKTKTMPDDEFLMSAWIDACGRAERSPVEMCADVATNLWMQPMARYIAATELGLHGGNPLAREALETCLIESTGDGMLRIKAAQAIAKGYPRENACAIFEDVLSREVSINFRKFLEDVISHYCSGGQEE